MTSASPPTNASSGRISTLIPATKASAASKDRLTFLARCRRPTGCLRMAGGPPRYDRHCCSAGPGCAQRLRPADHHPPQQTEIRQHQTVFETGGGEVTGRRHRDVDQRTGGQHQRPPALQARRVQPGGPQHREHHAEHAERQREEQRHVLHPHRAADPRAEIDQIGPYGRGVRLDALAGVEHRTVARQQVSDRAQDDEAVVGDPAPLPCSPAEQRRDDDHAHPQADAGP